MALQVPGLMAVPSDSSRTVEQRLRAAVDSSPSGLLMVDATGTIVLVNREVERLFGYAREDLLGRPVDLLVPERFRADHPSFRGSFLADPRVRSMGAGRDLYGLRKDGSEVPVEIGLTPVATEEGLFVISSVVDISARKRAEVRFRAAVESSPSGMVMVDEQGRIVLVNREVERLFGYDRDELLGQPVEILVPERLRAAHPGHRHGFMAHPQARAMGVGRELYGLRKDGSEVPVEIGLNPIETEEGLLVLSAIVDISARKSAEQEQARLEERLRQAQKMEALGTLAGGIAHDFNNILSAIVGYAELARDAAQASSAGGDLAALLAAADRGRQLVQRILTFTRRQERERRSVVLAQAVSEVVRLLRASLPASIDIRLELDDRAPAVLGDPTSVHQVVMNLSTNAAHAMATGGVLEIGVRPRYVRDSAARVHSDLHEGDYSVLAVRDTGTGIDPSIRDRIFEPFFTTKGDAGSGLGLATVLSIMREHGGAVLVASGEAGKGTTVECFFPAQSATGDDEPPVVVRTPRGGGERVLYVDDEPSLAEIGRRRLTAFGYEVSAEVDAERALELFRSDPERFQLVITDYSMPHLGGVDLAREVTAIRPGTPILLLTGFIEDLPPDALARAGIRRVLRKPLTADALGLAVAEILGREGVDPPS